MPTETLVPDAILSQTNLSGTVTDIQNDDASWLTTTGTGSELNVSFPSPTGNPTTGVGLQTFRIIVRKNATGGGDPTIDEMSLYENGTLVTTLLSNQVVTSTTGQTVSVTWDASALGTADGSLVEAHIITSKGGGGPNERNVEYGYVAWDVEYDSVVTNVSRLILNGSTVTSVNDANATALVLNGGTLTHDTAYSTNYLSLEGDTWTKN